MTGSTLDKALEGIKSAWGPLSTEVVDACRGHLEEILGSSPGEKWLQRLHQEAAANQEIYRDPEQGFVLLAHTETAGLYRPPHDHGRGWVIYAVQQGEIAMGTYARIQHPGADVRLVKRGSTVVGPGQVQVYLPGDIHDTRCLSGPALLFRFSDRDLRREDKEEHRVTRYVERDGGWTVSSS